MARIVGLDLGSYSVKAVALTTTLRGFQLAGYFEERLQAPTEGQTHVQVLAATAKTLLGRVGFTADTIICGYPGSDTITRLLRLPFTDPRKIDQIIPFEVGEQIPFDLDDVVLDHQVVATGEGNADVLVAAVRKTELHALLDAMKAVGVDPRVLCLDSVPALTLSQQVLAAETGPYAIIDIGHAHTSVSVLGQGGLQYVRTLTRGGAAVTQAIAAALEVDVATAEDLKHRHGGWDFGQVPEPGTESERVQAAIDATLRPLLLDLRQTFQAHAAQKRGRVEKLFLCGGSARLSGLAEFLAAGLGVEVQLLQVLRGPFAEFAKPDVPSELVPKALSLALRAVVGRGPQMNLRKGELAFKGDFQYLRGRIIQLSVGIVAVILLVSGYATARFITLDGYEKRQKAKLAEVTKATLGVEELEFTVAQNRISRGGVGGGLGELLPQTTAFDYLLELSKNIGKEKIDVKRLDIGPKRISFEGEIETIGALDAVVQQLGTFKCFEKNVRIMKSGKNQLNNRASFQLIITPTC